MRIFKPDFKETGGGYRFNRWIFRTYMWIALASIFLVAYLHDFNLNYYECQGPEGTICKNRFYKPLTWENSEYLPPGKYGYDARGLLDQVGIYTFLGFVASMLLNHIIHNKKYNLRHLKKNDGKRF